MRWMMAFLLMATALAGCSESGPAVNDETTSFDDVDVKVTEATGAILGVVVNDAIVPVADATVSITGTTLTTTTDDRGRFSFGDLDPGTYFLTATKEFHDEIQFTADVTAGIAEPGIVKVQLNRQFKAEPFLQTVDAAGFFTCSQASMAGYRYSSSSCHSLGPGTDLCDLGVYCFDQIRTFHTDVAPGWTQLIFEMDWEASAQGTSDRMGMVVSYDKELRDSGHQFANVASQSPMWFEIRTGQERDEAQAAGEYDKMVPKDGMERMSYFMSVRPAEDAACPAYCWPPGIALDQSFHVWHTQVYYGHTPDGWSAIRGDTNPFDT